MSEAHIKFFGVQTMVQKSKVGNYKCQNLVNHRRNMIALTTLYFINEIRDEGYETGYFQKGVGTILD